MMRKKILLLVLLLCFATTAMAVLVDDFDVDHDYTSGLTNFWDGFMDSGGNAVTAAASSSTGNLTLESADTYADGGATNLFLYADIDGNFEIETVVSVYELTNFNYGGIMVRNGANPTEDHVVNSWFDLFNVGNILHSTDDGGRAEIENDTTGGDNDVPAYLRVRRDGEDFYCTYSFDGVNWTEFDNSPITRSDMDVASLQVGLYQAAFSDLQCAFGFDYVIIREEVAALSGDTAVNEEGATSTTITVDLTGPAHTEQVDIVVKQAFTGEPNDVLLDGVDGALTLSFPVGTSQQTFDVQAVDDALQEGPETVTLITSVTSADSNYDDQLSQSITVTIDDNDQGTTVTNLGDGLLVDEDQTINDTFDVRLNLPLAAAGTVTVDVTTDGETEVNPTQLVFDETDYNVFQTVTVTGVDDEDLETDPHTGAISFSISSTDLAYAGDPFAADISVDIQENECGAWGYSDYDYNEDCIVNLEDLAQLASEWGLCTHPYDVGCDDLL